MANTAHFGQTQGRHRKRERVRKVEKGRECAGTISARQKLATPTGRRLHPPAVSVNDAVAAVVGFIALKSLCNVYASEIVIIVTCLGVRAGNVVVACNSNVPPDSVSVSVYQLLWLFPEGER